MLAAGPDAVSSPDNGSPYISAVHAIACRRLGLKHLRTRAYRPQTNGKACVSNPGAVRWGGEAAHSRRSDSGKGMSRMRLGCCFR